MAIPFGSAATSANVNSAFVSRTTDSDTIGVVGLKNAGSGGDVNNAQQAINDNTSGVATNAANIATNTANIATNTSDISTHVGASSGVHGVTGSVVGNTDTQSLTNKTMLRVGGNTIEPTQIDGVSINSTAAVEGQVLQNTGAELAFVAFGAKANSASQTMVGSDEITRLAAGYKVQFLRINAASEVTLSNTPLGDLVSDGVEAGSVFVIQNTGSNRIIINNNDAASGMILNGQMKIPQYGILVVVWDDINSRLVQLCSPNF